MASRGKFKIKSVPVLLDVAVTVFRSVIVLTRNGNFWTVSLLHSVSDIIGFLDSVHHLELEIENSVLDTDLFYFLVEGSQGTYARGSIHNS